jgi:tryptophanase
MDYVATALANVYEHRQSIVKGLRITGEAPIMRHFTVNLAKV